MFQVVYIEADVLISVFVMVAPFGLQAQALLRTSSRHQTRVPATSTGTRPVL